MMDLIMKATLEAVDTIQATKCQPPSLGSSVVDPAGKQMIMPTNVFLRDLGTIFTAVQTFL